MGNIGYLLGAGASVDAGLPTSRQLTRDVIKSLNSEYSSREHHALYDYDALRFLNFITGSLIYQACCRGENPFELPDIEDIYSSIEVIEKRDESGTNPFIVGEWHSVIEEFDTSFGAALKSARNQLEWKLLDFLYLSVEKAFGISYLHAILDSFSTQNSNCVFTLNYDNTIELLAKAHGWGIDFCLQELARQESENDRYIRLVKLHGSIDWKYDQEDTEEELKQAETFTRLSEQEMKEDKRERTLVFGRDSKISVRGPFLRLLSTFSQLLNEEVEKLLIVGYSFRDDHIDYFIKRWLTLDKNRKVIILDINPFKPALFGSNVPLQEKFPDQVDHVVGTAKEKLTEAIEKLKAF